MESEVYMESKKQILKNLTNAYKLLEKDLDGIEDPTALYLCTEILTRIRDLAEDIRTLE
jgi:uncharacterized protein YoxC